MPSTTINYLQVISSISRDRGGPVTGALSISHEMNKIFKKAVLLHTDLAKIDYDDRYKINIRSWNGSHKFRLFKAIYFVSIKKIERGHLHGLFDPICWLTALVFKVRRIPYVIQLHGCLEPIDLERSKYKKKIFLKIFGNFIIRSSSALISTSEEESAATKELGYHGSIIETRLGSFVFQEEYGCKPNNIDLSVFESTPKKKRILFLGRLAAKKNPDFICEIVPLLKEYLFVIAGPESDWTVQELKNQISLEDQKRVIFTNHVDEYEKTWLLYNSGTMLFPSDHENYGISLVEALCTGLPVIASEGVSSSRYIKDFSVGCAMARLDAGEWVGAIHKIYSESNEHQSRILELKARNFFEWRNFAIQVDNFWKNSDKSKVDRKHD